MSRLSLVGLLVLLGFSGCFSVPEKRLFQAKVPALPKPHPEKIEAERQASEYLVNRVTALPEPEPDLQTVSIALASSLGIAEQAPETAEEVVTNLRTGQVKDRKELARFETKIERYKGKEIEDTGINVAPGLGVGMITLLVLACIFVPGFGSLLIFVFKRLRGTTQQIVKSIAEFEKADPENSAKLKSYLSSNMDRGQKLLVRKLKG